jgi:3-mercaptopyruvate sulfurtransferase SseA
MPWEDFLFDDGIGFRPNVDLRKILKDAEIDFRDPATFFSQSGTQATVNFAVY